MSAEAVFEVKTTYANKTSYDTWDTITTPLERRAAKISNEYKLEFKKLDKGFAREVMGDETKGVVGPFEISRPASILQRSTGTTCLRMVWRTWS